MDIDLATSGLERIVGSDPPLDTIAHGLYFGEGPVWDRRNSRFLWTDIIADTIWPVLRSVIDQMGSAS